MKNFATIERKKSYMTKDTLAKKNKNFFSFACFLSAATAVAAAI